MLLGGRRLGSKRDLPPCCPSSPSLFFTSFDFYFFFYYFEGGTSTPCLIFAPGFCLGMSDSRHLALYLNGMGRTKRLRAFAVSRTAELFVVWETSWEGTFGFVVHFLRATIDLIPPIWQEDLGWMDSSSAWALDAIWNLWIVHIEKPWDIYICIEKQFKQKHNLPQKFAFPYVFLLFTFHRFTHTHHHSQRARQSPPSNPSRGRGALALPKL